MDRISDAAEAFLTLLYDDDFAYEFGNHAIQSEHVRFPTLRTAMLAMLRRAYLRGHADAQSNGVEPLDFDQDVTRTRRINGAHLGAVGGE